MGKLSKFDFLVGGVCSIPVVVIATGGLDAILFTATVGGFLIFIIGFIKDI